MRKARILIADDHSLILEGLRGLLHTSYEIVAEISDGQSLVDAAIRLNPDLVISDVSMPGLSGIEATIEMRKHLPLLKVLMLTMHRDTAYLASALKAGATGYVLKTAAYEELLEAVASVLRGEVYISCSVTGKHPARFNDLGNMAASLNLNRRNLSKREREVLQMIAAGKTAKEISAVLAISTRTVVFHRENIRGKLGVDSTAELTRYSVGHSELYV